MRPRGGREGLHRPCVTPLCRGEVRPVRRVIQSRGGGAELADG